ncbi:uncharacterized protein LOC129302659 [Prosopis cineraria]|uniref:uncharacterized protein LOC129302659 n=1 Tax=Prosopis cineraria TaxID=364024 RepID=UPI00240FBB26|nr:uncharacterized protein LOC129302659 [Prosopis cineraria]
MKSSISNYKLEIFVIVEPHISGIKVDEVIKSISFQYSHRVEAIGFSSGIWVFWSNKVNVKVIVNYIQFVHMKVCFLSKARSFFFSSIYGSPQAHFRKLLWSDLTGVAPTNTQLWLLVGDFNAIIHSDKRKGGPGRSNMGCHLFGPFANQYGLLDLGFNRPKYAWRRGTLLVRLDRALSNSAWLHSLYSYGVDHLPKILSDHRPLLIHLCP